MIRSWVVSVVAAAFFVIPLQARAQNMVLDGGTLIDGTGKNPINNAIIVVENGRIKAVGTKGQVTIPAGANVINIEARTILLGLIDGHIHLGSHQPGNPLMPQMFLHYGITTVGDTIACRIGSSLRIWSIAALPVGQ